MCSPDCSLPPIRTFVVLVTIASTLLTRASGENPVGGTFYPDSVEELLTDDVRTVYFVPHFDTDLNSSSSVDVSIRARVDDVTIATIDGPADWQVTFVNGTAEASNHSFVVKGQFLGWTQVRVVTDDASVVVAGNEPGAVLPVSVLRRRSTLDTVFLFSVIGLVCLAYVNMGCKLDFNVIKAVVRRPGALGVGIVCQYVFMPLVAFGLGYMFVGNPGLRLSLFVTGCCPGGGASNMWALLLGGNINLSVTVTFFSTILAFVAMPAWIFSLGRVIFEVEGLHIPYENVGTLVIGLVIPVGLGLLIKRFLPRVAKILAKAIKPFFAVIILYIVTFGIYTNLYVFSLLTPQIVLASVTLIWGGFLFGGFAAKAFRFSTEDCITLGLETGIQNAGVAIVLLRVSLPQPEADISLVFPILADIVMAIPPTIALVLLTYVCKSCHPASRKSDDEWPLPRVADMSDDSAEFDRAAPLSKQERLRRAVVTKDYQATS